MKEVSLKDPRPMGENDPKYGQAYWSYTYDNDTPVMFNLLSGSVGDGSRISAETVELKTSNKGTEYHRLKKVRVLGGSAAPAPTASASSDSGKLLQLIYNNTEKMLKLVENKPVSLKEAWDQATEEKPPFVPDDVVEDIGDEPIDLSAIPF